MGLNQSCMSEVRDSQGALASNFVRTYRTSKTLSREVKTRQSEAQRHSKIADVSQSCSVIPKARKYNMSA
jgi:hypothetical protein